MHELPTLRLLKGLSVSEFSHAGMVCSQPSQEGFRVVIWDVRIRVLGATSRVRLIQGWGHRLWGRSRSLEHQQLQPPSYKERRQPVCQFRKVLRGTNCQDHVASASRLFDNAQLLAQWNSAILY